MVAHAMWGLVVLFGILGALALLTPDAERRIVRRFTYKTPVRILGFCLLLLGMLLFALADRTGWRLLAQCMGVVFFLAGGINMALPEFMITLNESWIDKGQVAHRIVGLLYIGLAVLFYLATTPPPAPVL